MVVPDRPQATMNGNGGRSEVTAAHGTRGEAAPRSALLDSAAVGARERPNVLLVVLDTARADHFGPFHGHAYTPAFNSLAERGQAAVAISTSPWTVPSHASMFTGLLPFDHGVTGAAAITEDRRLASLRPAIERHRERWLPAVMAAAGYRTVGVSANVWITKEMGFDLGFEEFHPVGMARVTPRGAEPDHHWRIRDLAPDGVRRRGKRAARYLRDARKGRDFGLQEALAHVRELAARPVDPERPWFLFVNVMEAHAPYLPPPGFGELAPRDRFKGPALNHKYMGDAFVAAYNVGAVDDIVKEELRVLRRLYRAEVEYVDTFLAGAMDALHGHLDRTVVVVTADHGENLGEDHRLGHVAALDERLVRVPLAVLGRDARPVYDGMSLAALAGVVAGAAGLEGHPYPEPSGVAVAQYESAWRHLRRATEVGSHYELTPAQAELLRSPMSLATDGRSWLVRTDTAERAWSTAGEDVDDRPLRAALEGLPTTPPATPAQGATPEQEAEIESRLRELGYL
jgi:arylsulfatase A-like enzyme